MKKRKTELVRTQTLLENDRLCVGENFNELIISDLTKLLSDYFDLSSDINLKIIKIGDRYKLEFNTVISRLKQFGVLPTIN